MVVLRKMDSDEFGAFAEYSVRDYANDLMENQGMDKADAVAQAQREFGELFPDGMDTPGNALMVIEAKRRPVGVIWYLYESTDGVHYTFLNDFVIAPDERRKGYAAAAMAEMERDAVAHGCSECRLYVWKGNSSALALYAKCGYSAFRQADDGLYMRKILVTQA